MNQSFEGLVLFVRKYRDHDVIVKILTDQFGPMMFFVKGGQSPKHHLRSVLIPFSYQSYIGIINETGFSFIKEGKTLYLPYKIQEEYHLQAYATYFADLITYQEMDPNRFKILFQLLVCLINRLDQEQDPRILTLYFEVKLLSFFGIDLNWKTCQFCDQDQGPFDFSIQKRGLLCGQHWHLDPYRLHIIPRVIEISRRFAYYDLDQIKSISLRDESIRELDRLMKDVYDEFIGVRPKSRRFIEEMEEKELAFQEILRSRLKKKEEMAEGIQENQND